MPSSFDDESNRRTTNGKPSGSIIGSNSSLKTVSRSQPSMAELSSGGNSAIDTVDEHIRYFYAKLKHSNGGSSSGGVVGRKLLNAKQLIHNKKSKNRYERESSTSSDELDLWDEKQREDIVGHCITKMLNDGHVPHFGYIPPVQPSTPSPNTNNDENGDDTFQLSPLFSSRNYRALRKYILATFRSRNSSSSVERQAATPRDRHSMRFILETFAAVYIAIVSMNDIVLRSLSEFVLYTMVGTVASILFDVDEIKHASTSLLLAIVPGFATDVLKRIGALVRRIQESIEEALLWGYYFQGRILLWSDEESLVKFRREHKRLVSTINERRQKRKATRRIKAERRRRAKRGDAFTSLEVQEMETEIQAKEKLEADYKEFMMRPPTYLPDKAMERVDTDSLRKSYATRCHLESIQYCHKMILLERERNDSKPVSIQPAENGKGRCSPVCSKEAVEVVDKLPGSSPTNNFDYQRQLSQLSDDNDLFPFSDIFSNTEDGSNSNYSSDRDDDDEDDATSKGTYESDSTQRSMPWMVVGAKIGHKLLSARKLRRLTMNPDAAQNLIPDEAKKLIDGISKDRSLESQPSPSKSKSLDDSGSVDRSNNDISISISPTKSNEQLEIKRPVHRMWTSAGSAAQTLNTFGAVTLAVSPTEDQSVSLDNVSFAESHHSFDNTPSRRPLHNGIRAPPSSPEVELSVCISSPPKRGSLPLISHMPTLVQSGIPEKYQNVYDGNTVPQLNVTRLAPLEKGT